MTPNLRLENALAWIREGSLRPPEGFDPAAKGEDAYDRASLLVQSVFQGGDGEAVLQLLLDATLFRPPVDHRLGQHEYLRFAQLREGQNSAVAILLQYLDHAADLQRTETNARSQSDTASGGPFSGRPGFYAGLDDGPRDDDGPGFATR